MTGGEDFVGTTSSVKFKPGTTTANFGVRVTKDRKFEGAEFFIIQLVEMHTSEKFKVQVVDPRTAFGQIIDES